MLPGGSTRIPLLIIIGLLTLNLCLCGMFSYQGSGVRQVGFQPRTVSSGSSNTVRPSIFGGPSVIGGGPSSGK